MNEEKKAPNSSSENESDAPVEAAAEDEVAVAEGDENGDEEVKDPVEQVAELEQELAKNHDRLIRSVAELDNVRKRARRDVDEAAMRGRTEVLREILPAMDSIDLALKSADPQGAADAIIEGMRMVRQQFMASTERFQLKPIESVGHGFDPNFHEAVAQVTSEEYDAGQIVEEMRKGYMLGDRLLRAAMVVVSRGAPEQAPKDATPDEQASPGSSSRGDSSSPEDNEAKAVGDTETTEETAGHEVEDE